MSSKYRIDITKLAGGGEREGLITAAYGSLKLVAAAVKEGLAEIKDESGDFAADFTEMTEGGDREVTRVKGSARVVSLVLSDAVKQERKQDADAAGQSEQDAATEHTTDAL